LDEGAIPSTSTIFALTAAAFSEQCIGAKMVLCNRAQRFELVLHLHHYHLKRSSTALTRKIGKINTRTTVVLGCAELFFLCIRQDAAFDEKKVTVQPRAKVCAGVALAPSFNLKGSR